MIEGAHGFAPTATYAMTTTQSLTNPSHSFSQYLRNSSRIVALVGAGLSTSSGIPTFRGTGSQWRGLSPSQEICSPYCLQRNPVLFWQYFDWRRYLALKALPNAGHVSLARLAVAKPNLLVISQNIDGKKRDKLFYNYSNEVR
jgi:NAD+-dependent protein deacetylase sirtuin 5